MADRTIITVHSTKPKKIAEVVSIIADDFERIERVANAGAVVPLRNRNGRMIGSYQKRKRIHE